MGQWGMNPGFFGFAGGRSSISRGGNLHQPTCPSHPSHPSHPLPQPPNRPFPRPPSRPTIPAALSPIRGFSCFFITLYLRRVYWFICIGGFTGLYVSVGLLVYLFLGLFKLWLYSRLPLYISCGGFLLLLLVALPFLLTTLEHFSFFTYYSGLFLFLLTALQKVFPVTTYGLFPVTTSGLLPFCFQSTSNILPMYFQCTTVKLLKL